MPVRLRKLIGGVGLVAFVVAYAVAVVALGEKLPDNAWIKAVYFGVSGFAWGVPALPLLRWMREKPGEIADS
eukprot:gene12671-biopygen6577